MTRIGRLLFLAGVLSSVAAAASATATGKARSQFLVTVPVEYGVTFDPIQIPDPLTAGENESIGLLGIRFDLLPGSGFRVGLGALVGGFGRHGGFLVVGPGVGFDVPIAYPVRLQFDLFAGGGGGGGVPTNGGLVVRSSAGVAVDIGAVSLGGGYSALWFPGIGTVSSQPFGRISVASDFTLLGSRAAAPRRALQWRRARWTLRPSGKIYLLPDAGATGSTSPVGLVGFRLDHTFSPPWLTSVELFGAFAGNVGGFSSLSIGLGVDLAITEVVHFVPRVHLGAAGGGGVATGGGLFIEPSAELALALTREIALSGGGGYVASFGGSLRTLALMGGVQIAFDTVESDERVRERNVALGPVERMTAWRFLVGGARYLSSGLAARGKGTLDDISLLALRFDLRLRYGFFLSALSYWPVAGGGGGYAAGLLGLGWEQRLVDPVSLSLRVSGGAGAGGPVRAGSGALLQGNAGLVVRVYREVSAEAGGGYLVWANGLRIPSLELGVRYAFVLPLGV